MAVNKLDPKIIFASEAPAQDTPAVFNNRTLGWGESRKNGGRPTIKQMNALQQDTELKILWLNENAVTPFDATIDYPVNTVTIKDGQFKIFDGTSWNLFLDKSSVGLNNVDNTSDLNKPIPTSVGVKLDYIDKNGAALPYNVGITYEENAIVVKDGVLQQWKGGVWVSINKTNHNELLGRDVGDAHPASAISYGSISQDSRNDGLNNITEMLAIQNPKDGMRVYVKGYRSPTLFVEANPFKGGGWFVYDSAKSTVNDGGVVISGWVRQIEDRVTPCMFGAYADDSTNDVAYIQSSIDFAITHKKILDFEGRYYCVKKETYTADVFQHFLSINGEIEIVGNNASVRIDQSAAPVASKIMTLFKLTRKPEDATNYTKSIGRIHIHGFDFDGGFNYDNETDFTTIQDVKKCFFFYSFEVIYDELKIESNRFRRFAQQNVIAVGFSPSFKTYGIAKKTQILDNLFYDNGLDADMSTLYIMSNDITVSASNKFEQPVGREKHCLCAMELHGSKANVTGNTFKNMVSWVNLSTNEIENLVGEYIVTNNTGEAIENLARIWSGETPEEAELSEIVVSHNTVKFIDSAQFDVTNKNRSLLGTGGFNKSLNSLIVCGNTARTKTLSDVKPVYFVDIAVQLDWVSDIGNINISGNSGFNMTGFAAIGRFTTQAIDNCLIRNISINGNTLFNTADAYIKAVTINQIDDPTVSVRNLNVYGNTISSTFNKLYWFIRGEGNIENIDIGLNIYNEKPIDGALVFVKSPLRLSTSQSRNVSEYGNIPSGRGSKVYSCKTEYLYESIPASLLTITGTTAEVAVGVLFSGVRVKGARVKMPIGFVTILGGDNFSGYLNRSGTTADRLTDSIGLLDRPTPTMNFKINQDATWAFSENKYITLNLTTNNATYLNNLKASGGNIEVEIEVEKLI